MSVDPGQAPSGAPAACIDVHGHGVPLAFVEEVRRTGLGGVTVASEGGGHRLRFPGEQPLRPVAGIMTEFGQRSRWLDQQHVDVQIVAPWLDVHGQQLPAVVGRQWVSLLNDAMTSAVAEGGGRLRAHATVHLGDPEAAARELERAHSELGLRSCMIPVSVGDEYIDGAMLEPLWEAASALGMPVVLHPPTEAPSSALFGRFPRLTQLGRVIDTTIAAAGLITAGVLDKFPELQLVLVHGGGFLPYQVGRLDQTFENDGGPLPSDHARRMNYDSTLLSPEGVRMLVDFVGADRLTVGSDYAATSASGGWDRRQLTANVTGSGIGEPEQSLVLRGNAERLFAISR
jgi:aminocarboxymuconate-semialdehyde decarboxylase